VQFKDHFSARSTEYAQFRPRYPAELFEYLAGIAPDRSRAWDCATGNGQAATGLARFFESVIATDASEKQIGNAERNERVEYRVAVADQSGLEARSVSLMTVAQALHWFDVDLFNSEVKRVLKPEGVLAIWCYNLCNISPAIDAFVEDFYHNIVGPYWDPARHLVEAGYRTVPFPFTEIETPKFQIEAVWPLDHLLGYLRTWSATKGFIATRGFDPVTRLADQLAPLWNNAADRKTVRWPLNVRAGRSSS
jgi:SAM-dependent methyltransferase